MTTKYVYVNCPSCNSIHTLGTSSDATEKGLPEDMWGNATITITCPVGGMVTKTIVHANTDPTLAKYLTLPEEQEELEEQEEQEEQEELEEQK